MIIHKTNTKPLRPVGLIFNQRKTMAFNKSLSQVLTVRSLCPITTISFCLDRPFYVSDHPFFVSDRPFFVCDRPLFISDRPFFISNRMFFVLDRAFFVSCCLF